VQLIHLLPCWGATINHAWTKHGPIAKTACFIEDLDSKLACGGDDQNQGFATYATVTIVRLREVWTGGRQLLRLPHEFGQDGNEKGGGLARAWKLSAYDVEKN